MLADGVDQRTDHWRSRHCQLLLARCDGQVHGPVWCIVQHGSNLLACIIVLDLGTLELAVGVVIQH